MNITFLLTILGVIVSLVFGSWGVYLAFQKRHPGEITFVKQDIISLFDEIVKNLPDLSILYKKKSASPNLVLIRGAFINTGKKDIESRMIENPITLVLPDGYKWLASEVVSSSVNVEANAHIDNENTIRISNGLLRCNEHIGIQALAEIPRNEENHAEWEELIFESIRVQHRISDTRPIQLYTNHESNDGVNIQRASFYTLLMGVWVSFMFILLMSIESSKIIYPIVQGNDTTMVMSRPSPTGKIIVKSLDGKYSASISPEKFYQNTKKPIVKNDFRFSWSYMLNDAFGGPIVFSLGLSAIFFTFIIFIVTSYRKYKKKKVLKLLKANY